MCFGLPPGRTLRYGLPEWRGTFVDVCCRCKKPRKAKNKAKVDGKNMILLAFRVTFSFQPVIRLAPGCLPSNQSSSLGRSPGNGFAWWHSLVTSATWPQKGQKCEGCYGCLKKHLKWEYFDKSRHRLGPLHNLPRIACRQQLSACVDICQKASF